MKRYLLILLVFSSCAISRKVQYDNVQAELKPLDQVITIAAWDQRPAVTDRSRKSDFVGYTRSGVGIAYPMGTRSGDPLSKDIVMSLSNSLSLQHEYLVPPVNSSEESIIKGVSNDNRKLLILKLNEYHTDGVGVQYLHFDVDAKVYDTDGQLIVEKNFKSDRPIGGNAVWGPGKYKNYMPEALKKKLAEIFNDPDISSAI